jgi:hypothetical protein
MYMIVANVFAMLGFIRRLSLEFRDPYTLKPLYTSLVRPKLEYARCVWNPFYDVRWVGSTCMICHHMRIDTLFCILTPQSVLDLITPRYPSCPTILNLKTKISWALVSDSLIFQTILIALIPSNQKI